MTGVFIVLISVAVICWLIVKKFYPAWSLFVVGIVTIAIVAAISGDPVATGKKVTGFILSQHNFSVNNFIDVIFGIFVNNQFYPITEDLCSCGLARCYVVISAL